MVAGRILVVDDSAVSRVVLQRAVETLGHQVQSVHDGLAALARLEGEPLDAVLLDVEMPGLDGYATLQRIKADRRFAHLPVIMVSGVEDIESVVRCIELGAADYLPKPFNAAILKARLDAVLIAKRLRDRELDVLVQVDLLAAAAAAVEQARFEASDLAGVVGRDDALGRLGRVFVQMAAEVVEREQRLRGQVEQLRLDMEGDAQDSELSLVAQLASYVAMDRRQAMAHGRELPGRSEGAVLLADVSGFTAAAASRAQDLGAGRGAEELLRDLNRFYDGVVSEIHRFGGAVVGYAGDGLTCWFDDERCTSGGAAAAVAAGLGLQRVLHESAAAPTFTGVALKVAVALGEVRRFAVGGMDTSFGGQLHPFLDIMKGRVVADAQSLERVARPGDVLATSKVAERLGVRLRSRPAFNDVESGRNAVSVEGLDDAESDVKPWPEIPRGGLTPVMLRPWVLPAVFDQARRGHAGFLAELRVVGALFVRLDAIEPSEPARPSRLHGVVDWLHSVLDRHHGTLLQLTVGESSGYAYACFGAPTGGPHASASTVSAARSLLRPPAAFGLEKPAIGISYGPMRVGAYGGVGQRTYGAIGSHTNLAARLMQMARPGEVLAEAGVLVASGRADEFVPAGEHTLKGFTAPVPIFALADAASGSGGLDALGLSHALTVKVASVLGRDFSAAALAAVHPDHTSGAHLDDLCRLGVLEKLAADLFGFIDAELQQEAYSRLLFAQRRQLHRLALAHLEDAGRPEHVDTISWFRSLATHSEASEDTDRACLYLERAADAAREAGRLTEALTLFEGSLRLGRGESSAQPVRG